MRCRLRSGWRVGLAAGWIALAAVITTPAAAIPSVSPSGVAAAQGSPLGAAPAPAGVHVSGNRLVNNTGAAVTFRGVSVSGTEFACIQGGSPGARGWSIYGGQPLAEPATFTAVASWNLDVVRVPLNEDCWLGINGAVAPYGGEAYRAAVRSEVAAIHAAGLYAVLDLHWSAPGRWAAYGQQPMPDADHSVAFWTSVATSFRADPAVLFDLFNEPYLLWLSGADPWKCWLHGCTLSRVVTSGQTGPDGQATGYTVDASWKAAGMQQLLDAVRATGATQPIVVNGADWANDVSGWESHQPRDPLGQLVVGWHSYPRQGCDARACWDGTVAPLAARHPVLVGETGDTTVAPPSWLPSFLPWADAHGLNYLAWTWNPWQDGNNVLITDWAGDPTAGFGRYYRDHVRAAVAAPPVAIPSEDGAVAAAAATRNPQTPTGRSATSLWVVAGTATAAVLVAFARLRRWRRLRAHNRRALSKM